MINSVENETGKAGGMMINYAGRIKYERNQFDIQSYMLKCIVYARKKFVVFLFYIRYI